MNPKDQIEDERARAKSFNIQKALEDSAISFKNHYQIPLEEAMKIVTGTCSRSQAIAHVHGFSPEIATRVANCEVSIVYALRHLKTF